MARKEAERFPSELLSQFCQKNKLPRPHIMARQVSKNKHGKNNATTTTTTTSTAADDGATGGNWQGCVKMPDPKGKKEKDRYFRTVETFADDKMAKQSASLLVRLWSLFSQC